MPVTIEWLKKTYGNPSNERNMALLYLPPELTSANAFLPKRVYANKDLHAPLVKALNLCKTRGVLCEIRAFSGCFNVRSMRGGASQSKHSWGYAVDFNAEDNVMGKTREQLQRDGKKPFTEAFLQCFRDAGFTCGGDWGGRHKDLMHFEL